MALNSIAKQKILTTLKEEHFFHPHEVAETVERWIEDERINKHHPIGRLTVVARLVNEYSKDEYQTEPQPSELSIEQRRTVAGGSAAFWQNYDGLD